MGDLFPYPHIYIDLIFEFLRRIHLIQHGDKLHQQSDADCSLHSLKTVQFWKSMILSEVDLWFCLPSILDVGIRIIMLLKKIKPKCFPFLSTLAAIYF